MREVLTMMWILPVYVMVAVLACFVGIGNADNPRWLFNYGMVLGLLMLVLSPLVAKAVGVL